MICPAETRDAASEAFAARAAAAIATRAIGPCITGRNGPTPAPGAPALPVYSDTCGYLPATYGDDC